MPFDRNAINSGRRIIDFGLCDPKGVYQHTSRLRAKGFLAVAFLKPLDEASIAVAKRLQEWSSLSDKLAVVGITLGERSDDDRLVKESGATYPMLWDFESYIAMQWSIAAAPTVFIVNAMGLVLGRVIGNDPAELDAARKMILDEIAQAEAAAKAAAEAAAAKAAEAAAAQKK